MTAENSKPEFEIGNKFTAQYISNQEILKRESIEACFGFGVFDHWNLFRASSFDPRGFLLAATFTFFRFIF